MFYQQRLTNEVEENNNVVQKKSANKIVLYLTSHLQAILSGCGRLTKTPLATLMTVFVIGIALALPTALFVLLQNAKMLSQNWNDSSQISIYLKMNLSQNQIQNLLQRLQQQTNITSIKYISPEQGLTEFQKQIGLENVLSTLKNNPLPGVILIQPSDSLDTQEGLTQLLQTLHQQPEVDTVQLDMQWIKRLHAIVELGKQLTYAIGILLATGVLFIIGNIINLSLQKYRREIELLKIIGATDSFIRRPFLYTGMLYGFLGSFIAWLLVTCLLLGLQTPVHRLAELYSSHFQLHNLGLSNGMKLIITGIILGSIGAWLAIGKHLRDI
jgi:cell division transport system permease protein